MVVLLPHAWEGQGPDHSSGRLERFLEQAAEGNIRVANCSTAAQYYFLLRRQAASLGAGAKPLVVMTPKSLLRNPLASSHASELVDAAFQSVIDDPLVRDQPQRVRRVALCSGHMWAELVADKRRAEHASLAIVRVEELYPFPCERLEQLLERYANAEEVLWVQEEPRNMGAYPFISRMLGRPLRYVGRPASPSPAEGWAEAHHAEQRRIMSEVFDGN
jgi:2-oxoglutarate dehydrogenase E1 component